MLKKVTLFSVLVLLLSFVVPTSLGSFTSIGEATPANNIIITEVYYDTQISYEPDEYIAISNPLSTSIDISGWSISDGTYEVTFPSNTMINSGETIYIVNEAATFLQQKIVNVIPTFEYGADTNSSVPQMVVNGGTPRFANSGDEVLLKNGNQIIDVVVYGNSSYSGDGWNGIPILGISEGAILVR